LADGDQFPLKSVRAKGEGEWVEEGSPAQRKLRHSWVLRRTRIAWSVTLHWTRQIVWNANSAADRRTSWASRFSLALCARRGRSPATDTDLRNSLRPGTPLGWI